MNTITAPAGQVGEPIMRAMMMPRDTNYNGTIFGGIILSLIDQAAGTVAAVRAQASVVTLKMNEVIFHHPVFVGDLVSVYANVVSVGRTSMKIQARVYAHRRDGGEPVHVTSAELVFVAIGPDHRPIPVPTE
jgi:acyl-CoA thioesterase YciA